MDWYFDAANDTMLVTFIAIFVIAGIVAMVFFLLNLRDLLRQVRPQYQAMKPNQVWLNLIPLFGYVWMIITVIKVRDSVRSEFQSRGWAPQGDFGFGVGLAFAILSIFSGLLTFIPLLVCWVMYWIKTSELKRQLVRSQPPAGWAPLSAPPSYGGPTSPGAYSSTGATGPRPSGRTCSSCGKVSEPGDVFCRSCGADLSAKPEVDVYETSDEDQKHCPYCGAGNRPNAQFCNSCGRPIS